VSTRFPHLKTRSQELRFVADRKSHDEIETQSQNRLDEGKGGTGSRKMKLQSAIYTIVSFECCVAYHNLQFIQSYNHLILYFPAVATGDATGGDGLFKNLGGTPLAA
jgi:hypothetical protein